MEAEPLRDNTGANDAIRRALAQEDFQPEAYSDTETRTIQVQDAVGNMRTVKFVGELPRLDDLTDH